MKRGIRHKGIGWVKTLLFITAFISTLWILNPSTSPTAWAISWNNPLTTPCENNQYTCHEEFRGATGLLVVGLLLAVMAITLVLWGYQGKKKNLSTLKNILFGVNTIISGGVAIFLMTYHLCKSSSYCVYFTNAVSATGIVTMAVILVSKGGVMRNGLKTMIKYMRKPKESKEKITQIISLIELAEKYIGIEDINSAKVIYARIKPLYTRLDDEEKSIIIEDIKELYENISKEENEKDLNTKRTKKLKLKEEKETSKVKTTERKSTAQHLGRHKQLKETNIDEDAHYDSKRTKEHTENYSLHSKTTKNRFMWTGVHGLDKMLHNGIPRGNAVIIAGGTGSGKTLLALQIMYNALSRGERCLFITLEESEQRLVEHMRDFGRDVEQYVKSNQLMIYRMNPFDLKRSVDALLAQLKGELLIDVQPVILPKEFKPDLIVVDSLTAIAATFVGKEDTYRVYIEQFFRYLETTGATSFLISETDQIPTKFSPTGTEEFLSDGVIVLYSFEIKTKKMRAIEILKLRGASHERKIVTFEIKEHSGIEVNYNKEVSVRPHN